MLLPGKSSLFIDYQKIKRDAFILLNIGYGFNKLKEDDEGDVFCRADAKIFLEYGESYEGLVSEKLINISISARILDDKLSTLKPELSASKFSYEEILGDDQDGSYINLRQCFNKVIHSVSIDHELLQLPEVYLSGKNLNGKEWHIRLFLLPFCVAVYQWVCACENA